MTFYETKVLSQIAARFVIFSLGAPLFSDFQQSTSVCPKQRYQPEISTYCHLCTGCTTFSIFLAKCSILSKEQNSVISPHCEHYLLVNFSKVHEFVHNSVFGPRSARFLIYELGAPLLSDFQQSARVCPKQRY